MIVFDHFTKQYKDFQLELSMEIPDNKVIGIIGRNGCGKSTTIKAILGLVKPTSGSVKVFDRAVGDLTPRDKERIGVALSDSMFSALLSVEDIIAILRAMYRNFDESFFREMCGKLDLPLKKQLKDFSTGMKAKVRILTAISHKADLLILDEPTAGLDVEARNEIISFLKDYVGSHACTILITSHISSDLEGLCDEFFLFAEGKVLLHESGDNIESRYGTVQIPFEMFETIDKDCISGYRKETFGYACITNDREYFETHHPEIRVKPASIDDFIVLIGGAEE